MKVVFIVNNKNNRLAKLLPRLEEYCAQANMGSVQFVSTQRKQHAIELATQATESGCDYLVAVGGDGTLCEVINGVLQSNKLTDEYPAIGLLPHGSGNDFARTARVSNSIEELIELIQSDTTLKIDIGKIVIHQTLETRYFINIAGVGLSEGVVKNLEQSSSVFGSNFNYFKNIIKAFLSYVKKEVSCTSGTWQWKGKLLQMAVANGRYFGKAICIAPDAEVTDGQFQVAVFGDLSIWDYLKNILNLKKGVKINHPQVSYRDAEEVFIEGNDACGIEADGEYVGLAPATISILPKAICFLMPPNVRRIDTKNIFTNLYQILSIMKNQKPTLFIVDDEPLLSEMLSDYLKEKYAGFNIRSFPTGEACLESLHENPDIIILDFYLNSKEKDAANGIDILKEIKNRNENLPVIMLSSQKSYGVATKTIMYGAVHYVLKGEEAFNEIYQLVKANV